MLVPGGQFVLAEPGEGHAETEKSRAEMTTHGVCEREIHLHEAVDYGQRAGFDAIRVIPHFVPSAEMSPADFGRAIETPPDRWRMRQDGRSVDFGALVLQSTLNHPILVFEKGQRPLDSRMPRELSARLEPRLERVGASQPEGIARVRHRHHTADDGADEAGRVRLGLQLLTPERRLVDQDFARGTLPADVAPGIRVEVPVEVHLPDPAVPYVLKLDMVDEHVCWFEDRGGRPVYVSV